MKSPVPPPTILFPSTLYFQIRQSTSLWKKIVLVAQAKNWSAREVIEHAMSIAYYLHEIETREKQAISHDKRNF